MKKICCNSLAKLNLAQNCEIVKTFSSQHLSKQFCKHPDHATSHQRQIEQENTSRLHIMLPDAQNRAQSE